MKWTWIGLFVRVVAMLQVFQFEFCRASEHSKKLQMYDFISKDGCGRTISKGMNILANEMDAVPEYSIWNLGERICRETARSHKTMSKLGNLFWTLRPGKRLPGVAGMVTTICSVTRPSSRFHTNILARTDMVVVMSKMIESILW